MAPHEFVEIRLVCKADYLDPQLKVKLREIKEKLRQILHTGRRRFALKKVQPWNSVKVTFDIPKEAADRLRLLAVQGNARLIELGILSVEIVGQSNAILVNHNTTANNTNNTNTTNTTITTATANNNNGLIAAAPIPSATNSKDIVVSSTLTPKTPIDPLPGTIESIPSSSTVNVSFDNKTDDHHRHKRVKLDNDADHQTYTSPNHTPYKDRSISSSTNNLMQPPAPSSVASSSLSVMGHSTSHYTSQTSVQLVHRPVTPSQTPMNNYSRLSHPNSITVTRSPYLNSGNPPPMSPSTLSSSNSYSTPTTIDSSNLSNGMSNEIHSYHHQYPTDSWSAYPDHSNAYKMKVNGVRSNHYYPQQQPLIISDNPSSSSTMYCTQATNQYDIRRCEATMPPMTTSTANLPNSYDGSSTGLSS